MLYDPQCEELARYFLQERPDAHDAVKGLAQAIQDAVENWIGGNVCICGEENPVEDCPIHGLCPECEHLISLHDDKYGCQFERGDAFVTGNQPSQPTVLMAQGPCGCKAATFKKPRCQQRNKETGQCELRAQHKGKHLAGYMVW